MEFKNLIGQKVKNCFDVEGIISDANNKKIWVDFNDKKIEYGYDVFTRDSLTFINQDYQKIVDEEKKRIRERNNTEQKPRELNKKDKKMDDIRKTLSNNNLNIDIHSDFDSSLEDNTIKAGCAIEINDTLKIYGKLVNPFNLNKSAYKNPEGDSLYAKDAREDVSVWFLGHNNLYDEINKKNTGWNNIISDEYVEETWFFHSMNDKNRKKKFNDYKNECNKAKKPRAVFAKLKEGLYVFIGIYKIIEFIDFKQIDPTKDLGFMKYKRISNTLTSKTLKIKSESVVGRNHQ